MNRKVSVFWPVLYTLAGLLYGGQASAADGAWIRGAGAPSVVRGDAIDKASAVAAAHSAAAGPGPTCTQSLQRLIDSTPAHGQLQLPSCAFRQAATVRRPIAIVGGVGSEIRGSDVWTRWRQSNGGWISGDVVPPLDTPGQCRPDRPHCAVRRQVFIDGSPLTESAQATSGAFAVTDDGHIILGLDPDGRTVEVGVRERWLDVESADVTIQDVGFRHAINGPQAEEGALRVDASDRFSLLDSTLALAHGALLGVRGGSQLVVRGNDLGEAGQEAFAITGAVDGRFSSNRVHDNNSAGFDPEWEAGGGKATRIRRFRFDSNEVTNNAGPGIWCDIDCTDVTMSANRVSGNERAGLFYEISSTGRITGNAVWSNGWGKSEFGWGAGILLSSSASTTVEGNVVGWNADGITVVSQDRNDAPGDAGSAISVRDNFVVVGQDPSRPYVLAWLDDDGPSLFDPGRGNSGSGNAFWAPAGSLRMAWNGDHEEIASFSALPGGRGSRLVTESERDARLVAASIPTVAAAHPAGAPESLLGSRSGRIAAIAAAGLAAALVVVAIAGVAFRWRRGRRTVRLDDESDA